MYGDARPPTRPCARVNDAFGYALLCYGLGISSGRTRNSFNVERMVMHTVKEVKGWTHAALSSAVSGAATASAMDEDDDNISADEEPGTTLTQTCETMKSR